MFLPALLQLYCPHMDAFQDIPINPNLWGQNCTECFRGSHAGHSGIISLDTAQDVVYPLGCQDTLVAPVELCQIPSAGLVSSPSSPSLSCAWHCSILGAESVI